MRLKRAGKGLLALVAANVVSALAVIAAALGMGVLDVGARSLFGAGLPTALITVVVVGVGLVTAGLTVMRVAG